MPKNEKNEIVSKWRPDDWEELVKGLVANCIQAGELEIDDDDREKIEGFVRYCITAGADLVIRSLREYGIAAIYDRGALSIVMSKLKVPGKPQYLKLPMSYRSKSGYAGPGRFVFIPEDKVLIQEGE